MSKSLPNNTILNRRMIAAFLLFSLIIPGYALAQETPDASSVEYPELFAQALDAAKAGQTEEALEKFFHLAQGETPLAESALFEAMELAAKADDATEAGQIAHRFLHSYPYSAFRHQAELRHAQGLTAEGAGVAALKIVDQLLEKNPEDPPGDLSLLRAEALFAAAKYDEAAEAAALVAYQSVQWDNSKKAAALIAQIKKVDGKKPKAPTRTEMVALFDYYFDKEWFVTAGYVADKTRRLYPGSDEAWLLARRKVGCLIYRNRWRTAKKELKNVAKHITKSRPTRAFELIYSTRVGSRAGQSFASRMKTLKEAAKMGKGTRAEAEARFTMGKFYDDANNYAQAAKHYQAAAALVGGGWLAETALWRAGFALHMAGDDAQAADVLSGLYLTDPNDQDADMYLYWWARAAEGSGDRAKAEQLYLQVVREYPRTYYGLASELRLEIMGYPDFRAQWAMEEKILQITHAVQLGIPTLEPLGFDEDNPEIDRVRDRKILDHYAQYGPAAARGAMSAVLALLDQGQVKRATEYLSIMESRLADDPGALYYISVAFNLCGRELQAIKAADAAARKIRNRELIDPWRLTAKRRFPLLYFDEIKAAAEDKKLDPWLVISLVKQESAFQTQSHSWAGARGLMQVIPSTGRYIARKRGIKKKYDLFDVETSLDFGTWYFAQAYQGTKGDAPRTLAGYNAGPGRATRWWGENEGRTYDEAIERIPFNETRYYVKIILRNWEMYQRLYVDKDLFPERENVFTVLARVIENVEYYDD